MQLNFGKFKTVLYLPQLKKILKIKIKQQVEYENNDKKMESVFSKRIKAGKRRTYFFDVRETRGSDYFLTITESRKRFDDNGYDRHKIFLYKEDFNKFVKGLIEAVDYVKTELMPDFDFDAFNHEYPENGVEIPASAAEAVEAEATVADKKETIEMPVPIAENIIPENTISDININTEEVDKW